MAGRRPRHDAVSESAYRYRGYESTKGWVSPLEECEENGDHRVTPNAWPPPRTGTSIADPSLNMQCELCGSWVVVYEGHADGRLQGVEVILPKEFVKS